jgi:hypothetical protein
MLVLRYYSWDFGDRRKTGPERAQTRINVKDLSRSHLTSREIRAVYGRTPGPEGVVLANANLALLSVVILFVAAVMFVLGEALDLGSMSRAIEDAVRQAR